MNRKLFQKYKNIIIPVLFIVSSFFIFFEVVLKSIGSIGALSQDIKNEEKKLSDYKNSLSILSSLDSGNLSQDFEKVTAALPPSKNIQGIFLTLNDTALQSGVVVSGFSVKAGEVFDKNSKPKKVEEKPIVGVSVNLAGVDKSNLLNFIEKLDDNYPLSKVQVIDLINSIGVLDLDFYYKPFDLNKINSNVVQKVTEEEKKILEDLRS